MSGESRNDRLMAALACVVLAAMLGGLAFWAWNGVVMAGRDHERFAATPRAQQNIEGFVLYLIPVAGLLTTAALGLFGLGVWILMPRRKGRRRRRGITAR